MGHYPLTSMAMIRLSIRKPAGSWDVCNKITVWQETNP